MAAMLMGLLAAAACTRSPPEDFGSRQPGTGAALPPAASAAVMPTPGGAGVPPGRCVRPTPAAAPAAVSPGPAPGCPVDPEGGPPAVPLVKVRFADSGATVDAELVRSSHDTERGLMYRKAMAEDHGMIFDLVTREDHQFWMHNTCIPLDLVYVDEDGLIVGIVENAPTLDDTSRGVGCPSRYVVEVNAGWSRRHGVKAGQRVAIPREAQNP